jgi:hypothetical protein
VPQEPAAGYLFPPARDRAANGLTLCQGWTIDACEPDTQPGQHDDEALMAKIRELTRHWTRHTQASPR